MLIPYAQSQTKVPTWASNFNFASGVMTCLTTYICIPIEVVAMVHNRGLEVQPSNGTSSFPNQAFPNDFFKFSLLLLLFDNIFVCKSRHGTRHVWWFRVTMETIEESFFRCLSFLRMAPPVSVASAAITTRSTFH
jgi:hypothetical protein